MMQNNIFRWRTGRGLIALAGGGDWNAEDNVSITANLLSHTLSQGPIAYIWAASNIEQADHHMDLLRDLGARTGYLVDVLTEEDDVLFHQLSEAGVILLGEGPFGDRLHEALVGVAMQAIEEAYRRGASLYAIGPGAAMWGAYAVREANLVEGFNWLAGSIILPGYSPDDADRLRAWVHQYPDSYGLGLGAGSALMLGPNGELDVWGNGAITISLGQHYDIG
jgi:hypothetical protein